MGASQELAAQGAPAPGDVKSDHPCLFREWPFRGQFVVGFRGDDGRDSSANWPGKKEQSKAKKVRIDRGRNKVHNPHPSE